MVFGRTMKLGKLSESRRLREDKGVLMASPRGAL